MFLQESHLPESDFHRLNKLCMGQVYGSPAVQDKAGVITLLHKNFSHSHILHINEQDSSVSIDEILCGCTEFTLCNGPNGDNAKFFDNLGVQIQQKGSGFVVLGGNLNTVHSTMEDRRSRDDRLKPRPPRASDVTPTRRAGISPFFPMYSTRGPE